ncbi:uncharacterized protein SPPG_08654 [Spizellomyces punctatus DAOM BR117]|uniref:Uncharacterized protein n=1 Tax=Spizellomyces punctatus (strain DAOM BR117) TaxID=645134 RepID=A0A0L0H584_SPIPD|nr:uncharacterized protein SPPG_08654 [Spizellomyces punctatus DAOM BR117]KNC95893.1 hypothetical protein SPPG_08654 [Spizellomyces punctatus DAOM BR117]|eukprot:XP_016603933.1 hypothetical protein SPPG_08654 [Spizellomyces punctatus DAOM BR117]
MDTQLPGAVLQPPNTLVHRHGREASAYDLESSIDPTSAAIDGPTPVDIVHANDSGKSTPEPTSAPAQLGTLKTTIPPPPIVFHTDAVIILLRILLIFFLVPGVSLWLTFALCVTVNVGYTTFSLINSKPSNETILYLLAFAFYLHALQRVVRSLLRTALRMGVSIWRCGFGAGAKDMWPGRWVDHTIMKWKPWVLHMLCLPSVPDDLTGDLPAGTPQGTNKALTLGDLSIDKLDPHSPHAKFFIRVEWFKLFLLFLLFLLVLAGPPLVLSVIDFWTAVGYLCASYAFASLFAIAVSNLCARLYRIGRYLRELFRNEMEHDRLRAMYVASAGFDSKSKGEGKDVAKGQVLNIIGNRLFWGSIIVFVSSIVLNSMRVYSTIAVLCGVFFLFGLIVRCRWYLPGYSNLTSVHQYIENVLPYDGKSAAPALVLFVARMLYDFCGIGCLVALDIGRMSIQSDVPERWKYFVDVKQVSNSVLASYAPTFFAIFFFRDALFLLPEKLISHKARVPLMVFVTLAMLALAISFRASYALYTYSTTLLIAILSLDLRDARFYWDRDGKTSGSSVRLPNIRRAHRTSLVLLFMLCTALAVSAIVGVCLNSKVPPPRDNRPSFLLRNSSVLPPFCAPAYPYSSAQPLDLHAFASLAEAAYEDSPLAMLAPTLSRLNMSASLISVPVTGDVHFVHFNLSSSGNSSPLHIISIRGTHGLDDVFQDIYLFSSPALLRFSSYFGTFFSLWPQQTLAQVVRLLYRYAANPALTYFFSVEDYVARVAAENSNVYVTGHSLGGGLALLTGASVNVPAVGFSAPGLASSYLAFGVTDKDTLMTGNVNTWLDGDPVPTLDGQMGSVVVLPCGTETWGAGCHSSVRIIERIAKLCRIATAT